MAIHVEFQPFLCPCSLCLTARELTALSALPARNTEQSSQEGPAIRLVPRVAARATNGQILDKAS
jgi:hypothetical protein